MNISRLMNHAQRIEKKKREKGRIKGLEKEVIRFQNNGQMVVIILDFIPIL